MKGLIYKELLLGKKNYIGFLVVTVGVISLGILVGLGTQFGNLKDYAVEDKARFFYIFVYAVYVLALFLVTEVSASIERDKVSGWRKIEYTMPVSAKKRVGSWYFIGGMVLGASFLLGLMNAGIMALMFGQTITGTMLKNMVIILLGAMVLLLVEIPVYQRFSAKTVERFWNIVFIAGMLVAVVASLIIALMIKDEEQILAIINNIVKIAGAFLNGFRYLAPIIIPLFTVSSFALSARWYQRREQ